MPRFEFPQMNKVKENSYEKVKKANNICFDCCLHLAFSAVVVANTTDSIPSWMHKADEFVAKMDKEKKDKSGVKLQPTNNESVYDSYIEKAKTQEQKNALLALKKDTSIGIGEWKRDALKIIGELPHDVKRIKVEDAERIIKEKS